MRSSVTALRELPGTALRELPGTALRELPGAAAAADRGFAPRSGVRMSGVKDGVLVGCRVGDAARAVCAP